MHRYFMTIQCAQGTSSNRRQYFLLFLTRCEMMSCSTLSANTWKNVVRIQWTLTTGTPLLQYKYSS